jgi:hypothetical protein
MRQHQRSFARPLHIASSGFQQRTCASAQVNRTGGYIHPAKRHRQLNSTNLNSLSISKSSG